MPVIYIKSLYEFRCDRCSDSLETDTHDVMEAGWLVEAPRAEADARNLVVTCRQCLIEKVKEAAR